MKNEEIPYDETDQQLSLWTASQMDAKKPFKTLNEINEEYEIFLPHVKAKELVDTTFVVYSIKEFESSQDDQKTALFCGCTFEDGEKFTTVLGGMAVMELLEKVMLAGNQSPIQVTLRHRSGGEHSGYYVIE